jgi:hypothetical protein
LKTTYQLISEIKTLKGGQDSAGDHPLKSSVVFSEQEFLVKPNSTLEGSTLDERRLAAGPSKQVKKSTVTKLKQRDLIDIIEEMENESVNSDSSKGDDS